MKIENDFKNDPNKPLLNRGTWTKEDLIKHEETQKLNTPDSRGRSIIVQIREDFGYTQKEISAIFNIKQNTWSRYEKGTREIPLSLFLEFVEYFKLSIEPTGRIVKTEESRKLMREVK